MSVYIQLSVADMLRDGIQIYCSSTGVLLIPVIVDTRYFLCVNTFADKAWEGSGRAPTLSIDYGITERSRMGLGRIDG